MKKKNQIIKHIYSKPTKAHTKQLKWKNHKNEKT